MDCFKLTISAYELTSKSSGVILKDLLAKVYQELNKNPSDEIGVMYEEHDKFPKVYYFYTSNKSILAKIRSRYEVERAEYPPNFAQGTPNVSYFGNHKVFPPKL